MDEHELIGRVLAGDSNAERTLYDGHVDRVFRLVYRMAGDLDRAQDYTQETFIRAFARLADFRGESALSTWLGSIAISVTLNGLRKVSGWVTGKWHWMSSADRPGHRDAEPDLKDRLAEAIDALPDGYRAVFVMHDVEGYTHEEIAGSLGVTGNLEGPAVSGPRPAPGITGRFRKGMTEMLDDRFDDQLRESARDYNTPRRRPRRKCGRLFRREAEGGEEGTREGENIGEGEPRLHRPTSPSVLRHRPPSRWPPASRPCWHWASGSDGSPAPVGLLQVQWSTVPATVLPARTMPPTGSRLPST